MIPPFTEHQVRSALTGFITGITPTYQVNGVVAAAPRFYDHALPPLANLLSSFKDLVVDASGDINYGFVTLAGLHPDKGSNPLDMDTKTARLYDYEIRYMRGIVVDRLVDPINQLSIVAAEEFYGFITDMEAVFDADIANTVQGTLGLDDTISHSPLFSVSTIQPWGILSGFLVYAAVLGVTVAVTPC